MFTITLSHSPTMLLAAFFLFTLFSLSSADVTSKIGINYGRQGNNLPTPYQSIELIRSVGAGHVKIYDADPETIKLLSQTHLYVTIMIPNQEITGISSNQTVADTWVRNNVLPYYPGTMIRYVLVGNEILSYNSGEDRAIWSHLVPAMRRVTNSLRSRGIHNIKVGTPMAMDVLQSSFPPSSGSFRYELTDSVILPLLKFLKGTNSFFFLDVYPYFPWSNDPKNIRLDFALFQGNVTYRDPKTGLVYTNLLDQMLDSVISAMDKLGYGNIRLAISETGWPNAGDVDEIGANIKNAATYNRNLIKKMAADPPIGTPARPGIAIPTLVFSLFDENRKTGPGTERHWGLFRSDGKPNYGIDFTGKKPDSDFEPLPEATNDVVSYRGKVWCVAAEGAGTAELVGALRYACGRGNNTCTALAPGRECYEPLSVTWHASYAFSSYWSQFRSRGCYFDGLAQETTMNPGNEQCEFPSVTI